MTDEVRLVLPAQEDFHRVAHLVVGGLGARLDLTFESLEDLQVAVDSLLGCREDEHDVTVVLRIEPTAVRASVGPFERGELAELDSDSAALGLRRVLETVCDTFEVEQRGGASWVELTKTAEAAGP